MKSISYCIASLLLVVSFNTAAQQEFEVRSFKEIIISPYISATLVEGEEEKVIVNSHTEPLDKFNVEVNGKTLRVYLDGAKDIPKSKKEEKDGYTRKVPLYKGTVLNLTIYYKKLNLLSIRGEEQILCESPISQEKFKLKLYGDAEVTLNEIQLDEFKVVAYGESDLNVLKGSSQEQRITVYGDSVIDMVSVENGRSKLTAYGEAEFKIYATERIKFTAYGEAVLKYKGSPDIDRGITIGESEIHQLH